MIYTPGPMRLRDVFVKLVPSVIAVLACASTATAASASSTVPRAKVPRAGLTCMPKPSLCGFPDATNTGVMPGVTLTPVAGTVNLSTPGQVYQNMQVTGGINVTAPNVTIRNVRLIVTDDYYGIKSFSNDLNLVLDHVEIDLNGHPGIKGIAFDGYTAKHVLFHNGADCAHMEVNVVIEDSYCVLGPDVNGDGNPDRSDFCNGGDHFDGFQSDRGENITIRHNTIRNPCSQTSAILMSTNTDAIDQVVIDNNLVSGGGYTIYCGTDSRGVATHETYTNNVTSREFFPNGGYWGPSTSCEHVAVSGGNVWDGNYIPPSLSPIPGGSPEKGAGTGSRSTGSGGGTKSGTGYLLSVRRAIQITGSALTRELGGRYTRRAKGLRITCRRSSKSAISCAVRWRGRRQRGGIYRRYKGTVTITRVAVHRWRYVLRVRSWSSRCDCSVLVRHQRTF